MGKSLIVIGTDTDVGKTYISGLILKFLTLGGYRTAYFKGAMSGTSLNSLGETTSSDVLEALRMSGVEQDERGACPYSFEAPVSPHLASRLTGRKIEYSQIESFFLALQNRVDYLVMEGSGGILCPLEFDEQGRLFLVDVIERLNLPCVLVSHSGLGAINHVGLTAHYLRTRGLSLRALVLNRYDASDVVCRDNLRVCRELVAPAIVTTTTFGRLNWSLNLSETLALFS